jgi:sugar phosphate isomerase/epimerase
MTTFRLGINSCFAVKRWPEPERWASVVRDQLGLEVVQHCLDLVDLGLGPRALSAQARGLRAACSGSGLILHSTFTGLAAYSTNLMLHPDPGWRRAAEAWFARAIEFSGEAGAGGTGGHVGAYSVADWREPSTRTKLASELVLRLHRLARAAMKSGLEAFYVENLASTREPSTMADVSRLLAPGDRLHVPVKLCLDVGHMCVPGTRGAERDPYAWLRRFGPGAVHVQQSDRIGDRHWPFTPAKNRLGRIDAVRVLAALTASGVPFVDLILEVIPPSEADDETVIRDLVASVHYWRRELSGTAA